MASHAPQFTIAVLTYNRADILRELLIQLAPLQGPDIELIVVDNCSADNTREVVAEAAPAATYIRTESNLGVGARNIGLRRAAAPLIVCLDDDVFGIDRVALATIARFFAEDRQLGGLNFKVIDAFTKVLCNWVHHRPETAADGEFDTYEITEGAVAFRKSAVEAAGFYPDYFFLSHEGPDLAFRIMNAGFTVRYTGSITVLHSHARAGRQSWASYYYDTRNQYWLAARNLPLGYGLKYLAQGQGSTFLYALRDGFVRHWFRAVKDGLVGLRRAYRDRKIVTPATLLALREIDSARPSLVAQAKKRLFKRDMRL